MRKTPQQYKRLSVKETIEKILGDTKTVLTPLSITTSESLHDEFTTTDFSFSIGGEKKEIVDLKDQKGKGLIDGLFTGLHKHFSEEYRSLEKIRLVDLKVNPIISSSKASLGTDSQASVLFSVHVHGHGLAEFQHKSRSMIYSSFVLALEAFQFYINCERVFDKIQLVIADAQTRNRGDTINRAMYDLSKITEVNTYEKKGKS